jgi:hypothetical protein
MNQRRPKRTHRPAGLKPEVLEGQEQNVTDPFCGQVVIPSWPDGQLPDALALYKFGLRQMAVLAAGCPDFTVRAAAARFFSTEFSPTKMATAAQPTEKQQLIAQLKAVIKGYLPEGEGEIELETVTSGAVVAEEGADRREEDSQ